MQFLKIVVPIVLIIMAFVELGKAVVSNDDKAIKTAVSALIKKTIAAVIIFFIPILINVIMGAVGESTEFSNCWNNAASAESIWNGTSYIEAEEEY